MLEEGENVDHAQPNHLIALKKEVEKPVDLLYRIKIKQSIIQILDGLRKDTLRVTTDQLKHKGALSNPTDHPGLTEEQMREVLATLGVVHPDPTITELAYQTLVALCDIQSVASKESTAPAISLSTAVSAWGDRISDVATARKTSIMPFKQAVACLQKANLIQTTAPGVAK